MRIGPINYLPGMTRQLCMALAALLIPLSGHAVQKVLPPDQVFLYEVSFNSESGQSDAGEILVQWDVADGYYLYKKKMSFASNTDGVVLGEPMMPTGETHEDEFFGKSEIYRGPALVRIPIVSRAPDVDELTLEIRSQGCADIGLCYPPQRWTADVSFKAGRLSSLRNLFTAADSGNSDEPLPPEEAFRPLVELIDPFRLAVTWTIADGYYLYRHSLTASTSATGVQTGTLLIPPGEEKTDEYFGETRVFYDEVLVEIPLSRATPQAISMALDLVYQGCKENSICYPTQSISIDVHLPAASSADQPAARTTAGAPQPGIMVSEQDQLSRLIGTGNLGLVMLTFLGLGLLLAFTPCVLPMVPILSGIIAGQGDVTTRKAFLLSLTYVLGMALTYTIAGALFAAAGQQVQSALQKPWIIISAAVLFVAMALSMFGLYELRIPASIQNRLSSAGGNQKAGTYIGTALMGMLSALVITSCVAPPLVATLAVIGQTGDIVRGASALFALSIGMGIPLLVIGTSAGRLIPKAGAWMNNVKGAFGFMMLGLAVWMLERVLPGGVILLMWAVLTFMAGVFMGAFQTMDAAAQPVQKLGKGLGLLAAIYGAVMLLGALTGGTDPLQPLKFSAGAQQEITHLSFKQIKSVADLEREVAQAASSGKPVMLDFYADWCVSCKEMEKYTFTDAGVQQALANTVTLQADVTANDDIDQALLQHFGIYGPPTIVFFGADGLERPNYRVVGYMPGAEFARHIEQFLQSPTPTS